MENIVLLSKRSKVGSILYWLFVYQCFCCFLIKNFGVPKTISFGIDFFYVIILVYVLKQKTSKELLLPKVILCTLIISTVVGTVVNSAELTNWIWGARSEFWGMAVLFACVKFLTLSDIERIMKFFFKFQFLNLACAAYQYHVLGYYQDFNNGAFLGGAYQDVFCALLFTYYFYKYIRHEDKLWKLVFVGLSGLYIAVVEEEKFIFIEFAGIIAYYFVSTGMNFAKILIMAGCVAAGVIALPILNSVNGQDSMEMLTSWDNFIGYATMTGYGYELPRLGSSSIISAKFFGDTTQDFFGLGLGMCEDASTVPFINTAFFQQWSWLHYMWFTFQIQFMQTGWIGIILYIAFFVSILAVNLVCRKNIPGNYKYFADFSVAMSFIAIAVIWYSCSTRGQAGNFVFFAIAIGMAINRQLKSNKNIKKLCKQK